MGDHEVVRGRHDQRGVLHRRRAGHDHLQIGPAVRPVERDSRGSRRRTIASVRPRRALRPPHTVTARRRRWPAASAGARRRTSSRARAPAGGCRRAAASRAPRRRGRPGRAAAPSSPRRGTSMPRRRRSSGRAASGPARDARARARRWRAARHPGRRGRSDRSPGARGCRPRSSTVARAPGGIGAASRSSSAVQRTVRAPAVAPTSGVTRTARRPRHPPGPFPHSRTHTLASGSGRGFVSVIVSRPCQRKPPSLPRRSSP